VALAVAGVARVAHAPGADGAGRVQRAVSAWGNGHPGTSVAVWRIDDERPEIVADGAVFDRRRTGPKWRPHYWRFAAPLSGLSSNQSYVGDGQSSQATAPERGTGARVRAALQSVGIRHTGRVVTGRTSQGGRDPRYTPLGRTSSPPLARILRLMNHTSDNHIAETVLKGLAGGERPATTAAAAARVEARLGESGVLGEQDQVVDGSGLSRANKISAASLARLVAAADRDKGWGAALIASLPRGGEGTLVRRLRSPRVKNRVRAKTGFLNGVTSLAGRVVSRRGHRYAFAILLEAENTAGGRRLQDGVVNLLARGVEDPPPSAPG
jgi:D-alanyl-D-alanine carboxypeptidase